MTLSKHKSNRQKGFTLVEMMVSSAIGLIAMSGVVSMFAASVKSSSDGLKRVRLNQELRAIMDVMVRDIRRAGYWRNADGITANPFSTLFVSNDKQCVTYRYDAVDIVPPALPDPTDNANNFGFKFQNNGIKYRTKSVTCDKNKDWTFISDVNAIKITDLNLQLNTTCTNLSALVNTDCETNAPGAGDTVSYMYMLDISLTGELTSDNTVSYTLTDTVSIRNSKPQ